VYCCITAFWDRTHRLVSIPSLEPDDEDDLVDRLLKSNPAFRALVEKSKASSRRPFPSGE
jgi:hypothetical protein